MIPLQRIGAVEFDAQQRRRFQSGDLPRDWSERYPELFDTDDLRLALRQPDYHFLEWLGAVVLFNTTGYRSLVEKYEFGEHSRKASIIQGMVPRDVLTVMRKRGVQCPDLFVYMPDGSDWFLCEVKGKRDKLRAEQRQYFESLSNISGRAVRLLEFREMTVQPSNPADRRQPPPSGPSVLGG